MQGSALQSQMRKLITLINKLRDMRLDTTLSLPKIVVLGNQSSGKSSLIEQIVGIDFLPRGQGVVTRRPLQLRMNYTESQKIPFAQFDEVLEDNKKKRFLDFKLVRDTIEQVTNDICKNNKNIKDIPIILNIYSEKCPNLTIVDLPGITLIPIQDQPENIYEITKQMTIKYISDPRSIILCVIPANQDLSNSEALHLMRKIDPEGKRSIGCLTKIDIMNRGEDATKILKNEQIPLRYGYVGVKNRSQLDINNNLSVQQSLQEQKMFFAKSPIYSSLPKEVCSTASLTKKLTKILFEQIKTTLPCIISEIKVKKTEIEQKLQKLGPKISQRSGQQRKYGWESIKNFMNKLKNSINGTNYSQHSCRSLINLQYYELYNDYSQGPTQNLSDREIQRIVNNHSSYSLNFLAIDVFYALIIPFLKRLSNPAKNANNKVSEIIWNEANCLVQKQVGKKYPDFKSSCQSLIQNVLERFRKKSQQSINYLIEAEINYFYTNDQSYLSQDFKLKEGDKRNGKVKNHMLFQLRQRVDGYYKLVIRNLKDLIPKNITSQLLVSFSKEMQLEFSSFLNDEERLKKMLIQSQSVRTQRAQLERQLAILRKSEFFLQSDPEFGKALTKDYANKKIKREKSLMVNPLKDKDNELKTDNQIKEDFPIIRQKIQIKNQREVSFEKNQAKKFKHERFFEDFFGIKASKSKEDTQGRLTNTDTEIEEQKNQTRNSASAALRKIFLLDKTSG